MYLFSLFIYFISFSKKNYLYKTIVYDGIWYIPDFEEVTLNGNFMKNYYHCYYVGSFTDRIDMNMECMLSINCSRYRDF